MRCLAALLAAFALSAETGAFVRGVLVTCQAQAGTGELSLRDAGGRVLRYRFDHKTYMERENARIDPSRLQAGERVEVVSEAGPDLRYAMTVHVVPPTARPQALTEGRLRAYRRAEDHAIPASLSTFSGVVARLGGGLLALRTKEPVLRTILLRRDTRYLESGAIVGAAELKPNMRVFVRAATGIDGELEAYEVIWGEILQPE